MKKIIIIELLAIAALSIFSCKKEQKIDLPVQQLNLTIGYVDMDGNHKITSTVSVDK